MTHPIKWKKFPVLNDGFICLVDHMGDDSAIVQAARVSYGKDKQHNVIDCPHCKTKTCYAKQRTPSNDGDLFECTTCGHTECVLHTDMQQKDRQLIRYLMAHGHTTPFEMVTIKFMVQVPMDCWRQWIRHRTASVNEYSTRYTEAIDSQQTTDPGEWRLQATDNKQGSSGFLEEWPEGTRHGDFITILPNGKELSGVLIGDSDDDEERTHSIPESPGAFLTDREKGFHNLANDLYQERLALGVAKEQARKDLPLSTYTRAYWKCDLHNIFNFLRLRMDPHAQLEIREYANAMFEIVKQICPVACEAFEDYVLNAKKFSAMEMEVLRKIVEQNNSPISVPMSPMDAPLDIENKPTSMSNREWKAFLEKLK